MERFIFFTPLKIDMFGIVVFYSKSRPYCLIYKSQCIRNDLKIMQKRRSTPAQRQQKIDPIMIQTADREIEATVQIFLLDPNMNISLVEELAANFLAHIFTKRPLLWLDTSENFIDYQISRYRMILSFPTHMGRTSDSFR